MDQTRGIDRKKPLQMQFIDVLYKRFLVEGNPLGGEMQVYKKAASALVSLASDWYAKHPEEAKHYVED